MDEFLALSSLLTGLRLENLHPSSVEARMARDYLRLMKEQFGSGFESLMAIYRPLVGDPEALKALLRDPGLGAEPVQAAARQLVNLWLLSQYGVTSGKLPDQDAGFYEKGFVWPAIKAHPIGFSHLNYGYWSRKPELTEP